MSSGVLRKYAPDNVTMIIGTQIATGFKEGTFIEVERSAETGSLDIGSDGEATLVISPNQSGTFKFTFQQSSPINDYLTGLFVALQNKDMANAVVPVKITDKNGSSTAAAKQAVVQKPAKMSFADKAESREWTLITGYLDLLNGGESSV